MAENRGPRPTALYLNPRNNGVRNNEARLYINDLEDDISNKVLKFADDTKVFRKVTNDTDKQSLQDDLDKLVKWSEK